MFEFVSVEGDGVGVTADAEMGVDMCGVWDCADAGSGGVYVVFLHRGQKGLFFLLVHYFCDGGGQEFQDGLAGHAVCQGLLYLFV